MQTIIRDIRSRLWNLPQAVELRSKAQRNQYMRRYMRDVYRKSRRRVTVTLHPAEYDKIQISAQRSGRKVAAFIRETTLASLAGHALIPKHVEQVIYQLTGQLRSAGNNLNQIAKHVNQQKKFPMPR